MQLNKETRKEVIRQYKERKPSLGVFAVRSSSTGRRWVGISRNLAAARNSLWFSLRLGSHRDATLQQVYRSLGEPDLSFEVLEMLEEDVAPLLIADLLKASKQRWMAELSASGLP